MKGRIVMEIEQRKTRFSIYMSIRSAIYWPFKLQDCNKFVGVDQTVPREIYGDSYNGLIKPTFYSDFI